ncbi:MAG: hypothetical protein UT02_C0002G0046 [Parcubacteria group bacterium GW2011_GWC2_38_7]|nr:MAG: hypothetical protein UT02_C0002G0046 [Parcubacteria group bacterium GW2011_GWC2_38_7]
MFKNLTKLGFKRTAKQAIGFYLAYLLLLLLCAGLLGGILAVVLNDTNLIAQISLKLGNIIAITVTLILSFFILKAKKLLGNFKYILVALLSGFLALFLGALAGLIPVAYLTTREKQENDNIHKQLK